MKIFNIILGIGWFVLAIMVLGNMFNWWTYELPDGSAFCACLFCSFGTLLISKEK